MLIKPIATEKSGFPALGILVDNASGWVVGTFLTEA